MECLEKINLFKANDNLKGFAGEEFGEPFRLKAASGTQDKTPGVSATAILVTYYEAKGVSDLVPKTAVIPANTDGIVEFSHPKTTFVGNGKVIMALFLQAQLEKLKKAEKKYPEKVAAVRKLAQAKKVEFQFTVLSKTRSIPMAVFVVDLDENGALLASNQQTASGINESLTREGIQVKTLRLDASFINSRSDEKLA